MQLAPLLGPSHDSRTCQAVLLQLPDTCHCCPCPPQWFTKAGFTDVKIKRIGPTWYRGVRRHGLIMGCSVTGVKPQVGGAGPLVWAERVRCIGTLMMRWHQQERACVMRPGLGWWLARSG